MITINSQLDMTPGAIPVVIHRSQYDSDFSIVFTLFARTGNFTIASGTTAKVRGTKKSGTGYSADATLNTSAKTVTVAGNQQMTVVSGQNIFEIVLMSGTKELCSANFILNVERAALDMDTITDDTVIRELDNLDQFVADAESAANRAETAAATFSVDATLTVSGAAADAKKTGDSLADKVDKVSGKGLSTEDYTTEEKTKLAGIETGATKTTIDSTLTVSGKAADAKTVGDAIASEDKKALAAFATDTASGSIASFPDGADSIPMKDVLVHIEPVQAGSGDPSPENVRPITGWTAAKVTRAGKNIFLPARTSGTTTNAGITFTYNADGTITASGTATATAFSTAYPQTGLRFRLPPGRYKKSGASGNFDGILIQYINPADPTGSWVTVSPAAQTSFTISETVSNYDLVSRVRVAAGKTLENETYYPYIFFDSSDDTYEPYTGTTYSITFPSSAGTIYGGTLDVTSGVLTVDRAMLYAKDINFTEKPIALNDGTGYYIYGGLVFPIASKNKISNIYKSSIIANAWKDRTFGEFQTDTKALVITLPPEADTLAKAKQWIIDNDPYFVYELATPVTYTLTPQEITSLLGTNNLWADTGDSEVEYRANTELYITKKITEAVSALS